MKKLSTISQRNLLIAILITVITGISFLWQYIPDGEECSSNECNIATATVLSIQP